MRKLKALVVLWIAANLLLGTVAVGFAAPKWQRQDNQPIVQEVEPLETLIEEAAEILAGIDANDVEKVLSGVRQIENKVSRMDDAITNELDDEDAAALEELIDDLNDFIVALDVADFKKENLEIIGERVGELMDAVDILKGEVADIDENEDLEDLLNAIGTLQENLEDLWKDVEEAMAEAEKDEVIAAKEEIAKDLEDVEESLAEILDKAVDDEKISGEQAEEILNDLLAIIEDLKDDELTGEEDIAGIIDALEGLIADIEDLDEDIDTEETLEKLEEVLADLQKLTDQDAEEDEDDEAVNPNIGNFKHQFQALLKAMRKEAIRIKKENKGLKLQEFNMFANRMRHRFYNLTTEDREKFLEDLTEELEDAAEDGLLQKEIFDLLNGVYAEKKDKEVKVYVKGKKSQFDVPPTLKEGRVLVPFRKIAEDLDADVNWDPDTKTVTVKKEGVKVVLKIGNKTAVINGASVALDVPAQMEKGRTLVPLRLISESFGKAPKWYGEGKIVVIED